MTTATALEQALNKFPRIEMGHLPSPLEEMPNLGAELGLDLWVKRDDCTGIGMGGNKVRQLQYYFGKALAQGADTVLITGAVQSNFVRTAAAFAARLNMECHIQLEERVPDVKALYRSNGNVLLSKLMGAHLHSFPDGEDEVAADAAVSDMAEKLKSQGKTPYIIPLGAASAPLGALGYIDAAIELDKQLKDQKEFDAIIIPTGSALTHTGLLFGLRTLENKTPITGICVRRDARLQGPRVAQRLDDIASMMQLENPVTPDDIDLFDGVLAPGYGQIGPAVIEAVTLTAQKEGLFLDPVYTGKSMAGLMALVQMGSLANKRVLFWHTGGTPALFGYGDQLV